MKMPNMGNSFVYFRQSSVPGVNSFKMVGFNYGLIPDRPSEPASKTDGQTTIRTRLSHAGTLLFLSPRKYKLITMTDKNVDNVMSIIFKQKYAPKITKTIH